MVSLMKAAVRFLLLVGLLTGVVYPGLIAGIAKLYRPRTALWLEWQGQVVGHLCLGQSFTRLDFFWGRPSTTAGGPYTVLQAAPPIAGYLPERRYQLLRTYTDAPIPVEMVMPSASGLDPHISVAGALIQAKRVAKARGLTEDSVHCLIRQHSLGRQWGVFGQERVVVLSLNLALLDLAMAHREQLPHVCLPKN